MAQINTKDLGQILIKETTADTNDVFNVLISQGAKGGFAVATQLINVLNISILFIMYQDHLILPLFLLFYHSAVSPSAFSEPSEVVPAPSPPSYKVNLKVCKVVLLCVLTSCGHCLLNQVEKKNQRWCQDHQQDSGIKYMKINCLSHKEKHSFSYTLL